MTTPIAPYSEGGAMSDGAPELSHIPAELHHLAVPIDSILLDPNNVNKHPADQIEVLKSMLAEFGQRQLLVARKSTGILEAGEGRVVAGKAIGWTHMAVLYFDDDPVTALRYALGDNRSARLSEVDESMLREQLLLLHEEGSDLASLGWTEDDVTAILEESEAEPDDLEEPDAGEPPVEPFIQPGDIVELGPHRLICGDSTDPTVIELVMQGELADLVITDPPYGVAYVGKSDDLAADRKVIANDNLGLDGTRDLVARAARAWPLRAGGVWYVCSPSGDMETAFRFGLVDAGQRLRQAIAWVKNAFVLSHQDYHYQHETLLYGWQAGAGHFWCGSRAEASVWNFPKPTRSADHPTMKPPPLLAKAMRNSSKRGDLVFDGFGGSGSTLVAAHQVHRRARLVELSPGFCDVIVRRAKAIGLPAIVRRAGVEMAWEERG